METVPQKSHLLHGLLGKTCHRVYVTRTYCLSKHEVFTIPVAFSFAILVIFNTFSSVFKKRYRLVRCHISKKSFRAECQCFPCKQKSTADILNNAMWCFYWPQASKRQIKCQPDVESSQMQLLSCISLLVLHLHQCCHFRRESIHQQKMLTFGREQRPTGHIKFLQGILKRKHAHGFIQIKSLMTLLCTFFIY